jgi:alanine racemase
MMQSDHPSPALRLDVDSAALACNYGALSALSGTARAGAAIKADAYGVGAAKVVPVLANAGCRDFFVAHWSEVRPLLGLIDPGAVSVLHGPLTAQDAAYARATGVKPTINSLHQARLWLDAGGGPCDLMVDTGINRLGLPMAALGDEAVGRIDVDVLMSHLASADEDVALNSVQQQRWAQAAAAIPAKRTSLANSAGIALGAAYHGDLTRPGLSLYGGIPRPELAGHIGQVVKPQAAIMQLRNIAAGEGVGYNSTFIAPAAMRVGVIALGYADGYLRCWSGKGMMFAGDAALPVLGRVSMDMTVINLTAAPHLREGDWVDVAYSLPEASETSGLSQYELLTLLGRRFGR